MQTRGAPAIAIVAVLALAVELGKQTFASGEEARKFIKEKLDYLVTSRPTAVNLADAAGKLERVVEAIPEGASAEEVVEKYVVAAEAMLEEDVSTNKAIGKHGAEWILKNAPGKEKVQVLTHCNTGSLATAGYGTALGIIRALHEAGRLEHAYCTETRPYNQGARLTAYELVQEGIPATLVTDSMVAALLSGKAGRGPIDAVIVGADRVVKNGDTANKIGTFTAAVCARQFGVKFVVAAPTTTIDPSTPTGADIEIEQRAADEVRIVKGLHVGGEGLAEVIVAPKEIDVWNPSFDVTPHEFIDVVVSEERAVEKVDGKFNF